MVTRTIKPPPGPVNDAPLSEAGPARTVAAKRDPERTREHILEAALAEFATKGFGGARIDEIAARAGANKRMIYHYFGNKEDLFLAVLERTYQTIRRSEEALSLKDLDPDAGMRKLINFTWRHFILHPEFVNLLNSENLHRARHLKRSKRIREMHSPLIEMIGDLLRRGHAAGVFRGGVDPVQLYISIAALGYFYHSNIHTLSTVFGRNLASDAALKARHDHIAGVIMGYLRP